jgi:ATP-binding cassette, subfamily B, bacterial
MMARRVVTGTAQAAFLAAPALVYLGAGIAIAGGSARYTAGTLVAFTALQIRAFVPVRELLATSLDLSSASSVYERVFAYLDLPHEITDAPDATPLPTTGERGRVELDHVSFGYDDRSLAVDDVTLEVAPGQLAALVGPSGAGKTTITYLIARLYDVHAGAIRIDGMDVRETTRASLVEAVGSVTQDIYLLNASVADNLRVARPDASDEEIEHAARVACIHERIAQFEHGYDTLVGERGYRLSGGEKQRLAIARVILRDPRVLLLDEATSALDTASERLVQRALAPVLEHRTTIAIAHRLSTIVAADVIFVLDQGRIVERGTHAELLAKGGAYAQLYEHQFAANGSPTSFAAATPARSAGDRSHMARP